MAFLIVEGDKFTDKTITTTKPVTFRKFGLKASLKLRHLSFSDGTDALVIDLETMNTLQWMFIRSGELIINLNDSVNITCEAHENFTDVSVLEGISYHIESAYYDITKDILKEICEADKVDIKITGSESNVTFSANKFLNYCRKFYNEFYGGNYFVKKNFWSKIFG